MSKHTPGPWTYYPEDNIIVSKSGYRLLDWIARSTAVSIDERNANARLIAAAPDLLDALKCVIGWSQSPNRYIPDTCIDQVRKAVAKATGE